MNEEPDGAKESLRYLWEFALSLILVLAMVTVALAAPQGQRPEPTPRTPPGTSPSPTHTFTPTPSPTPRPPTNTPKPTKMPTETEAPEEPTETTEPTTTPGLQPITLIPSGTATSVAQATYQPVVQTPPPPPPPPPPPTNTPTPTLPPTPTMTPTPSPTVTPTPTPVDTTPPAPPIHLTATSGRREITLNWTSSSEPDLAGYRLYRSTVSGGGYTKLASVVKGLTRYIDADVVENVRYYYVVTAFDINNNESGYSNEATGMISPAMPPSGGVILPELFSSPLFWSLILLAFLLLSRLVKVKEADSSQASD